MPRSPRHLVSRISVAAVLVAAVAFPAAAGAVGVRPEDPTSTPQSMPYFSDKTISAPAPAPSYVPPRKVEFGPDGRKIVIQPEDPTYKGEIVDIFSSNPPSYWRVPGGLWGPPAGPVTTPIAR